MNHKALMAAWEKELGKELLPVLQEQQNVYRCPSPFEKYPGHIDLPVTIPAAEYLEWWGLANPPEDKDAPEPPPEHFLAELWRERFHLIKSWSLTGLTSLELTPELKTMPDIAFGTWLAQLTQPLIVEATELPK